MPEKELTQEEVLHQQELNEKAAKPAEAVLGHKPVDPIVKDANEKLEQFREIDKLLDQQAGGGGGGGGTPKTVGDVGPAVEPN